MGIVETVRSFTPRAWCSKDVYAFSHRSLKHMARQNVQLDARSQCLETGQQVW